MPTPFYHLSIAQNIIEHAALDPALRSFLSENLGAFLLGNTAPDVQVISGQTRSTTHFFRVPIPLNAQVPWNKLLSEYTDETQPAINQPAKAAFIAGYLCHLQADWIWVRDIFEQVFGPHQDWETFSKRLYLHNVLRSYLDEKVIPTLGVSLISELREIIPQSWLSFLQKKFLLEWRDYLSEQLTSGENTKTVEVFAFRHGINPAAFQELIGSEQRMESNVFTHIPREQLDDYRADLLAQNIDLLQEYLSNFPRADNRFSGSIENSNRSAL